MQKNSYIITNNNDTVKGSFKLSMAQSEISNKYTFNNDEPDSIFFIKINNVEKGINVDTIKSLNLVCRNREDTTKYIFNHHHFWKLLISKNGMNVFAREYLVDNGFYLNFKTGYTQNDQEAQDIIITSDKFRIITTIYSGPLQYNGIHLWKEHEVLNFINLRYKLNLKLNDLLIFEDKYKKFDEQKELFSFILDKELKLQNETKATD
ncbi:MAG: hypothetical protein PW786_00205 [Arachidicoccus sp.]|nr:hypothetical protein [Arachidicoccus sp.]